MTPLSYWSLNEVVCVRTLMGCEEPSCRNQFWTLAPFCSARECWDRSRIAQCGPACSPHSWGKNIVFRLLRSHPPSKAVRLRVLMVHMPQEDSQLLGWVDDSEAESSCCCSRGPEFCSQCIRSSHLLSLQFSGIWCLPLALWAPPDRWHTHWQIYTKINH